MPPCFDNKQQMPQPHQGTPRTIRAKRVVLEEDSAAAATSDFFKLANSALWWHRQQQGRRPRVNGARKPDDVRERGERARPCRSATCPSLRMLSAREASRCVQHADSSHRLHRLHLRLVLHAVWQPTLSFGSSSSSCARRRCHSRRRSSTTRPSYAASPVTASGSSTRSVPRRSSCTAASPAGARATRTPSRSSARESSCASTSLQCWSHRPSMIGCTPTCSMTRNGWPLQVDVGVWHCPRPEARWGTARKGLLHAGPPASPSGLANDDPS